ncbi:MULTISPECIES: sodium:solute symporter [Eubacteriales]|uniref:sodium:solute symporter family protein n=1 Tax=Eubacteriales TaxID=186802 RepID=UPI00067F3DD7|nr:MULTISPECIES: sodium:solute symporter family protein [Eubacteriales]MBS5504492.1 sodium:solute symporter family protein [Oscillospiraceae bacterium]MBS5591102.1 sodium:solute symporter family protein [Clostridiales bacterium]MCB5925989.1 sodium:solute symporter family protein [bacterium 210820-DFI.5.26]MCQ5160411.1 sodium:solute symporter family protein [Clostridium sp. DFI.5.61]UMM47754.1 sodium:solute symporter family protein [Lawsonibacter asaccharolyticus]
MSYIIAIGAYLFLLMIYGLVIAHKKVKTADDMVTGGHRIPFIILVGSLLATWCGGGGITGNASIIYNGGPWVGAITFAAPPIGIILLYFIAGKVRKSNKVTVPEIMGARYGQSASIISAVCVMLAYVGVLATQLKAAADILVLLCSSSGVEISRGLALVICTTIIVVITVGGGLVSVAYSDAISALIMIGGFFIAIPILISVANAQGAVLPPEKTTLTGGMSGWELLGYFLPSLALMLGDQNMLQRFASAKNSTEAKKSNIGMFIGEILVIVSIIAVVTQAARLYPTLDTPSNVIFQVSVDYLPMAFGALIMCACMAFIVTTADSYLLSSATNLTNDIYVKYIRKDATDKQKMLVLRGTIVVFSVIAVALTLYFPTVLSLQMTAYTMYGAAITPAILFALFSKKVTPAAGIAGILVGGLATIVWTLMGTPYGIQCAIVAVPASVIAILVVSAVTPKGEAARSLDALYQEK